MDDQEKRLFDAFSETLNAWRAASDALAGGDPDKLGNSADSISTAWLNALGPNNPLLRELAAQNRPLTLDELQRLAAELLRGAQTSDEPLTEAKLASDGANLITSRAYKMLEADRLADARSLFHKALDIKGDHKPAWLGLAVTLTALGLPDAAADAQSQADSLPD